VVPLLAELRERFGELEAVVRFLQVVEEDVIHNASSFLARESEQAQQPSSPSPVAATQALDRPFLRRYGVNLLVDHGDDQGAPVIYEPNPTYNNLIGRVEHLSQMGALVTDFQLIRAGALHRADGGYLILDALKVLTTPFAWDALKRALLSRQIKLEPLGEALSLVTTYSLEPEPDPLEVKVVLLGPPILYYLLSYHDPDFPKLFKVAADFDDRMDRGATEEAVYARQVAGLVADEELRPFDRGAVARAIEDGSRHLGDARKLSLDLRRLRDLLREADHWAGWEGREVVTAEDVQRAIDEHTFRSDRLRERIYEGIHRGTLLIDTDGAHVGRINGLAVLQLGDFHFGRPSRITARVRMGKGEVVDIEREVELSGPFHSKGVMILAGFLGAHYARDHPLALKATVVFEQSYGGVDGDSASSTELYALLSAIAEVPIRQSLAVTGSINQQGEIQAIGGVNEKIEGFFDVCRARGLTGEQGVLIPASNVEHLMLRHDVVAAVAEGRFHVYPVRRVEEGIELLTGLPAGERDDSGDFPEGSFNRRVEERLIELAHAARAFSKSTDDSKPAEKAGGAAAGGGKEGA
jgi:lon-related putative ATP-dependent protease